MSSTAKRMRPAEPLEIPGSFPGRPKVHRRSMGDRDTSSSRGSGRSSEGGEWLKSLVLSPFRLAASWLVGGHEPQPAQKMAEAHRPTHRAHTHDRIRQANGVHGSALRSSGRRPGTPVRTPGTPGQRQQQQRRRRPLVASGGRHDSWKMRTIGLVREYTMRPPATVEWPQAAWREPPSAAASTGAYDSTPALSQLDDAQSTPSVDSSLGFRGETPLRLGVQIQPPAGIQSTAVAAAAGSADAWLAQLRRKIEDALAVSKPAAAVATAAYDRLRREGEALDERLAKAQQRDAFALPADAAAVLARAGSAGFAAELNNVPVTAHDMATLQDGKWLNDEVINFYMQLIMERAAQTPALPRVHAFNTFFYSTLRESGYARVRRWTRRARL
ncbi:hypothetical protein H4R21_006206, partial [Coemansia helicoidea]